MKGDNLFSSLYKEVPNWSTTEKLGFIFGTGSFISVFLIFFQPFGVNNYDPQETIRSEFLVYMIIMGFWVMILLALNEFLIRKLFPMVLTRITALSWIIWSLVYLSFGVFLFYNYLGGWHDWLFSSFLEFIVNIGVMSLIPLAGLLVYFRIRDLQSTLDQHYKYADSLETGEKILTLESENQKEQVSMPVKNLVFIESQDNYVAIRHLNNGVLEKSLLRRTLKSIEELDLSPALIRISRSFLINKIHLESVVGNRRNLKVNLANHSTSISVGEQYKEKVLALVDS